MDQIKLKTGERTKINLNRSVNFVIETLGGTLIEISVTPGRPLAITPGDDIKRIDMSINDNAFSPLHIVK
jgi:hypothetical protein